MSDESQTPPETTTETTTETTQASEPPAWFRDYQSQVQTQIQKISSTLGRLRAQTQGGTSPGSSGQADTPDPQPGSPPAAGPTHADIAAAMRLGQLTAGLPEPALERVTQRADAGDFRGAVELAEMARSIMDAASKSAEEPEKQRRVPRAHAATPRSAGTPHPRTLAEWRELKVKDPVAFEALRSDPSFDPTSLMRTKRK